MKLYHASRKKRLKWLKPFPHPVVNNDKVVFATTDKKFALAMSYGSGMELAVGYFENTKTKKKQFYVDELKPNALKLLEKSSSLYVVDNEGFEHDPRIMKEELISKKKVKVVKEIRIDNVLKRLKMLKAQIVLYDDVPYAMKTRKKDPKKPKRKWKKGRFKENKI